MAQSVHSGHIRKLLGADRTAFRDHLLRLDAETRRKRFQMATNDDYIRRYAAAGLDTDSIVHGYFADGILRGVGELRLLETDHTQAEAAFSVESDWQGAGIGSRLMEHTILSARNRGIGKVYMNCLANNRSMQHLAGSHGAELAFEGGEVVGVVLPPHASPASLVREVVQDSTGWISSAFDVRRRLWATTPASG